MSSPNPDRDDKLDEVLFLAETFDIPPVRAAALVADGAEAEALALAAIEHERQRDPLAGMPVPDPEKDPEHREKEIGDLGKPVVREDSAST
jgi:hypothetical protein